MDLATTAAEWLRVARETTVLRPRTTEGYAYCIGLLVKAGFRDTEELTRERVFAWLEARRSSGLDPQTLNRNLAAICALVGALERRGQATLERLLGLRRLRYKTAPVPPPFFLLPAQAQEVERVAFRVDRQLGVAVRLDLASGLRASELVSLRHEELRLDDRNPFLIVARDDERDPKNHRARTVPLRRADADRLLELELGAKREGPVFPAERRNSGSPYLAANSLGRRLGIVRAIVELPDKLDFIALRHTFASWHVQAGVSLAKVSRWLGNTIAVAERHYAGLIPGGDPDVERGFPLAQAV